MGDDDLFAQRSFLKRVVNDGWDGTREARDHWTAGKRATNNTTTIRTVPSVPSEVSEKDFSDDKLKGIDYQVWLHLFKKQLTERSISFPDHEADIDKINAGVLVQHANLKLSKAELSLQGAFLRSYAW